MEDKKIARYMVDFEPNPNLEKYLELTKEASELTERLREITSILQRIDIFPTVKAKTQTD